MSIEIDLNRISRAWYRDWTERLKTEEGDKDELSAEIVAKVVVRWPYEQPVSEDGYKNLGLADSIAVDRALSDALESISKKK